MASVNKVILVGNCGRDPETRSFPNGDQVCNVTIATTDRWKDKQSSEMREHTEWHRLVFNGRLAEIAGQYLRKGSQVYIEGSIRSRKYNDREGVEKIINEVRVDQMQMLGSREGMGGPSGDEEGGRSSSGGGGGAGAGGGGNYSRPSAPASRPAPPPQRQQPAAQSKPSSGFDDMDDDIPF